MECFYCEELEIDSVSVRLNVEESKHVRALRILDGDRVLLINGRGLSASAITGISGKFEYKFLVDAYEMNKGELPVRLGLAMGILDSKDRMEFALEKAVELGVTDFYPLITRYSSKSVIKTERLNAKALAATKQTLRSYLINIHEPLDISELPEISEDFERIILADIDGVHFTKPKSKKSTLVLVGPEGGFSKSEIEAINSFENLKVLNLGNRRLRAETAAMVSLALVSNALNENKIGY